MRRAVGALTLWVGMSLSALAATCDPVPTPVRDVVVPRFYADDAGSVVDPKLLAAHAKAVAPLNDFVRYVTQNADKALRRSNAKSQTELAICTLAWITGWARGDAWLGKMGTKQAEYQRKWDLAGVAIAYLKLRTFAAAEDRSVIEPWLRRLADVTRAYFDDPTHQRNNHWYWLGLAQAAVALGTDSPRHWEIARGIMRDAAADIAANGTLAKEMDRKQRALFYHVFAVMPLVVLAELGASKGEDWYAFGDGALHRLIDVTVRGLQTPAVFEPLAGLKQETPVNTRAGWLQLYRARFPERLREPLPQVGQSNRWIGGDALVLSAVVNGRPMPQR
jgi:poly(beta-D-mannuronate) lyase